MALDIKDLSEQLRPEGYEIVPIRRLSNRDAQTRAAVAALKAIETLTVEERRKALALATRMLSTR